MTFGSAALAQQLFLIPVENGRYLVYAPLKGIAFLANASLVNLIAGRCEANGGTDKGGTDISFLDRLDFFTPAPLPEDEYLEHGVQYNAAILFLTNRCSLRCSYCYASSGDYPPQEMTWDTAKAAIDHVLGEVEVRGSNDFVLGFHGGGEPTMNWDVLTRATEYARSMAKAKNIRIQITGAFNGYWPEKVRRYIITNFTGISLSFDGLPEVQNHQRPAAGGNESFAKVAATLEALDKVKKPYGIRMTVTKDSVHRLADSIAYICERFRPKKIQAEPVFLEGRALENNQAVTDRDLFISQFITAYRTAANHGAELFYSGARPDALTQRFCLAACRALVVTTQGDVTTCFETFGQDHPLSPRFIVGSLERNGKFHLDQGKLAVHFRRTVDNIPYCGDCFCRWHCAGDCAIKASAAGRVDEFAPTARCHINRELTKFLILDRIKASGGLVWVRNGRPQNLERRCYPCE